MRGPEDHNCFLPQRSDARRTGRVPIEGVVRCSLGKVLDLSLGGARILARRRVKGAIAIVRLSDEQGGFETEARVAWQKRLGFLRHEIGLRFPPLDDAARTVLQRLASDHRFKECMRDPDERRKAA